MTDVDLAIRLTSDASDAVDSFDDAGAAALGMADDIDRATRDADASGDRLGNVAEGADQMASSSSQAAGGLGDLGGALSLMPGPLGAVGAGMEAVAPAIMGVTGAADLLNLVTESNIVLSIRQKVAAVATRTVMLAQAAATYVVATAQRVLNAAMRANPVGLLITAITIVVGLMVLLYKRSETFRRIVQLVFAVARAYVMAYIKVITTVYGWLRDKLPAAALWLRDKVVAVWDYIRDKGTAAWDYYTDKVRRVIDLVRGIIDRVRETIERVADAVRDKLGGAFDWVLDKIQPIIDAVQGLFDKLDDLPSIPGLGRVTTTGTTATAVVPVAGDTVNITLPPLSVLDTATVARLVATLEQFYAGKGKRLKVVPL